MDHELLGLIDAGLPDVAIVLSPTGEVLHTSASVRWIGGWEPDELIGRPGLELVHPDDVPYALGALLETADNPGEHAPIELRFLKSDGSWVAAEVQSYNDPSDPGGRILLSVRDISMRSAMPERRRALETLVLSMGAQCAAATVDDLESVLAEVVARLGQLVDADEVRVTPVVADGASVASWTWIRPGVEARTTAPASSDDVDEAARRIDHPGRLRVDARTRSHAVLDQPVLDDAGAVLGLLSVCWHVPDARRYWDEGNQSLIEAAARIMTLTARRVLRERTLAHQAQHDPLTGLANRLHLVAAIDRELVRSSGRDDVGFALAYCDLDRFKAVNDTFGHAAGDRLLVEMGRRLRHSVRHGDLVCRVGGDEFVVLCPRVDSNRLAAWVAGRIAEDLVLPFPLVEGHELTVSASIGVVRVSGRSSGEMSPDDLLQVADHAMYEAKAQPGRGIRLVEVELSGGLRAVG